MSDFIIEQGMTAPVLNPTLRDAAGAVAPIAPGSTVVFQMQAAAGGPLVINAPATIVDGPNGKVSYAWTLADTANAGEFLGVFIVTDPGGNPQAFPSEPTNQLTITIFPKLAAAPGGREGPCSRWTTPARVLDAVPTVDPNKDLSDAIADASEQLYILSGRKYAGFCTATVRPMADARPAPGIEAFWRLPYGSWGNWGSWSSLHRFPDANVLSGVPQNLNRIWLPEARTVNVVKVDGVTLTSGVDYRLDGEYLVRLSSGNSGVRWWPQYQRIDRDDSQPDTFSIAYSFGYDPPRSGVNAASELAGRIALGEVTNLVNDTRMWDSGKTGLWVVDLFLSTVNPKGDRNQDTVWSPDLPSLWRTT
jgi:hypothetical protein